MASAPSAEHSDPGLHRRVGGAPAQHQQVRPVGIVDLDLGNLVGNVRYLPRPDVGHQLVVGGIVGDVPRHLLLLQAAYAVLEAGHSGDRPPASHGLEIPQVGQELVAAVRSGRERHPAPREGRDVRKPPRLRSGGDIAVGEEDDRGHVLNGDLGFFDRHLECVRRG